MRIKWVLRGTKIKLKQIKNDCMYFCGTYSRLLFFGAVFYDIAYFAVEDKAKLINGFCGDRQVMLHAVYCICRYALFEYQIVFGDIFFYQSFEKRAVADHNSAPFRNFIYFFDYIKLYPLTALNMLSIITTISIN